MAKKTGFGLRSLLKSVFNPPPTAAAEAEEKPIPPMKGEEDHWVAVSLEEMLRREPDLAVHVISLCHYRQALGPLWPKTGPKVMLLSEGVLGKLKRHGALIREQDDCFLVMYQGISAEEGNRLTGAVAIELGQRLVGAKFSLVKEDIPQISFATVPATALLNNGGQLDGEKLGAIAQAAERVDVAAQTTTPIGRTAAAATPSLHAIEEVEHQPDNKWIPLPERPQKPAPNIIMKPIEPRSRKRADPQWVPLKRDD